jgi:hypothetical protein
LELLWCFVLIRKASGAIGKSRQWCGKLWWKGMKSSLIQRISGAITTGNSVYEGLIKGLSPHLEGYMI